MHYWFREVLAMKIIQPLSLSSYFSVVVCLRWLYHHVLSVSYISRKNWVCVFYCCAALWCAHILKYIMARWWYSCLHIKLPSYHHYADLSEGIELLKCLSGNSVSSVCLRFSPFSLLSFMQYMGLCLLSSPIPLVIVRIRILYLIIIIKSDLWSICHCLGLGHETMVCAVWIFTFLQDYGISSPLAIKTPPFKKG